MFGHVHNLFHIIIINTIIYYRYSILRVYVFIHSQYNRGFAFIALRKEAVWVLRGAGGWGAGGSTNVTAGETRRIRGQKRQPLPGGPPTPRRDPCQSISSAKGMSMLLGQFLRRLSMVGIISFRCSHFSRCDYHTYASLILHVSSNTIQPYVSIVYAEEFLPPPQLCPDVSDPWSHSRTPPPHPRQFTPDNCIGGEVQHVVRLSTTMENDNANLSYFLNKLSYYIVKRVGWWGGDSRRSQVKL